MKVDGQCHCGAIVYEAEVEPGTVGVCHCLDCQRLTGSPFRANIRAEAAGFRILKGQPRHYVKTGDSGAKRIHAFCEVCASPIYSCGIENPQRGVTSDDEIVIALNLQRPIICCIHDAMSGRSTPVLRVGHVLHPIDG